VATSLQTDPKSFSSTKLLYHPPPLSSILFFNMVFDTRSRTSKYPEQREYRTQYRRPHERDTWDRQVPEASNSRPRKSSSRSVENLEVSLPRSSQDLNSNLPPKSKYDKKAPLSREPSTRPKSSRQLGPSTFDKRSPLPNFHAQSYKRHSKLPREFEETWPREAGFRQRMHEAIDFGDRPERGLGYSERNWIRQFQRGSWVSGAVLMAGQVALNLLKQELDLEDDVNDEVFMYDEQPCAPVHTVVTHIYGPSTLAATFPGTERQQKYCEYLDRIDDIECDDDSVDSEVSDEEEEEAQEDVAHRFIDDRPITPNEAKDRLNLYNQSWATIQALKSQTTKPAQKPQIPWPSISSRSKPLRYLRKAIINDEELPAIKAVKWNTYRFFCYSFGLVPIYCYNEDASRNDFDFEIGKLLGKDEKGMGSGKERLKGLREQLKMEKVRWHEDRVRGVFGEEWARDECVKAVWASVQELKARVETELNR